MAMVKLGGALEVLILAPKDYGMPSLGRWAVSVKIKNQDESLVRALEITELKNNGPAIQFLLLLSLNVSKKAS